MSITGGDTPTGTVGEETPTGTLGEETPTGTLGEGTPTGTLGDDTPTGTIGVTQMFDAADLAAVEKYKLNGELPRDLVVDEFILKHGYIVLDYGTIVKSCNASGKIGRWSPSKALTVMDILAREIG